MNQQPESQSFTVTLYPVASITSQARRLRLVPVVIISATQELIKMKDLCGVVLTLARFSIKRINLLLDPAATATTPRS